MRFQPRWPAAAAAMLAAVLASAESRAQLSAAQKQEMKQHYEKATRAYDVQKYGEAIDEYQKAYEIGGDPAMLFNIGQAYRLNDQLPEAVRFYRRYLQRSPNARNRDDVERKIADLDKTIEERRKIAAATAAPAATEPPVAQPATSPPAAVPPPAGTPDVIGVAPAPAAPGMDKGAGMRRAGLICLVVGGVALATAAVTGKMASDKAADLTDASNRGATFDPAVEEDGKLLNVTSIASAVVGGAAAVTGGVLILLSRRGASAEPAVAHALVAPFVGGGTFGAAATLRF